MTCTEGQFDVVELMVNDKFKTFSINLNAQHVNGMTPFYICTVIRYSRVLLLRLWVILKAKMTLRVKVTNCPRGAMKMALNWDNVMTDQTDWRVQLQMQIVCCTDSQLMLMHCKATNTIMKITIQTLHLSWRIRLFSCLSQNLNLTAKQRFEVEVHQYEGYLSSSNHFSHLTIR